MAAEQGNAGTSYEVPTRYMRGGPAVTAWLPAGTYRAISPDTFTDLIIQRLPPSAGIAWWRYGLAALGILGILAFGLIRPIMRRRARKLQSTPAAPRV